jgi:hypothetical protein
MGLSGIIRLMHMAGASDEVTENFIRLYNNAQSPNPLPPVVELGPVIELAAREAARVATYEWLNENGLQAKTPAGLADKAAAASSAASGIKGKGKTHIYHLQVSGKKTSLSLPTTLYDKSVETLGPEVTSKLIHELASSTPADVRRSAHVQVGLRKAVERAQRAPRPPSAVQ